MGNRARWRRAVIKEILREAGYSWKLRLKGKAVPRENTKAQVRREIAKKLMDGYAAGGKTYLAAVLYQFWEDFVAEVDREILGKITGDIR